MGEESKITNLVKLVIAIVVGSIISVFVKEYFATSPEPQGIYSILSETSEKVNEMCPMMVDDLTRLDSTSVTNMPSINYHYTLINTNASDIDIEFFAKQMDSITFSNVNKSKGMKPLKETGVAFKYIYHDQNGDLIHTSLVQGKL